MLGVRHFLMFLSLCWHMRQSFSLHSPFLDVLSYFLFRYVTSLSAANLKIKIVEKAGAKLGSYIKKFEKSNKKQNCGDKDCFVCKNSSKNSTKCRIPGAVYKITCIECEKQNKKACYYGETQFNGFTRGAQHQKNYRSKNKKVQEDSALRKHSKDVHDDKNINYRMDIIKTFNNKPLARQVYESVKIINSKNEDHYPMNSKKEFNQAMIVTAKFSRGIHKE